jgi:hypothetical protein
MPELAVPVEPNVLPPHVKVERSELQSDCRDQMERDVHGPPSHWQYRAERSRHGYDQRHSAQSYRTKLAAAAKVPRVDNFVRFQSRVRRA